MLPLIALVLSVLTYSLSLWGAGLNTQREGQSYADYEAKNRSLYVTSVIFVFIGMAGIGGSAYLISKQTPA